MEGALTLCLAPIAMYGKGGLAHGPSPVAPAHRSLRHPPLLSLSSPEPNPSDSHRSPLDASAGLWVTSCVAPPRHALLPGDAVAVIPSPGRAASAQEEAGGPPALGAGGLVRSGGNHGNCFFSIPPFADDSGDEEPASQSDKSELHGTLKTLSSKLEDLSTCNDLIAKHGAALQRSLSELENLKLPAESGEKIKAVNERATLFRITSNAMINVSAAG